SGLIVNVSMILVLLMAFLTGGSRIKSSTSQDTDPPLIAAQVDYKENKILEADFKNLHPNDFEDLYLLHLQDYTIVSKPRAVIYKDQNNQKKMMHEIEVQKFSDGTLQSILEKLDHMVKDFKLYVYNPGMEQEFGLRTIEGGVRILWSDIEERDVNDFKESFCGFLEGKKEEKDEWFFGQGWGSGNRKETMVSDTLNVEAKSTTSIGNGNVVTSVGSVELINASLDGSKENGKSYLIQAMVNFRSLDTNKPINVKADVKIPKASVLEVHSRFRFNLYGYFVGKRLIFPIVEYYVKNAWQKKETMVSDTLNIDAKSTTSIGDGNVVTSVGSVELINACLDGSKENGKSYLILAMVWLTRGNILCQM
nr:hypothetical protein [Tanacetum cinerariifolium]